METTDSHVPRPVRFSLRQLLLATGVVAVVAPFIPDIYNELWRHTYASYRYLLLSMAAIVGYSLGNLAFRLSPPFTHKRGFVRLTVVVALLAAAVSTGYILGAGMRLRGFDLFETQRTWPYPDPIIHHWADWLDRRNPAPWGTIKIHGEYDTVTDYLRMASLGMTAVTSALLAVAFPTLPQRVREVGGRARKRLQPKG